MKKGAGKQLDLMRPLTGKIKPVRFAVVDLETKDGDTQAKGFTRPFLAGYYDGVRPTIFYGNDCVDVMLRFLLLPEKDGMTFFAHFGGAFDWLHFLPALALSGFSFEIMTVSSKIQCLRVKPHKDSHKKGWTFLDSYQLIPAGLGKLTVAFDTEVKKDNDFDYDTDEKDPRWRDYLRDDLISLYQTLKKFYTLVEEKLKGEVGMTAASTAMKTYRRAFQKFPIERHDGRTAAQIAKGIKSKNHEFFRQAYFGGRVEIFKKKCEGVRYYDINSAYPAAMLEPMPVGKMIECIGEPPAWIRKGRIGFARVNVYVPTDTYLPVLPFRTPIGRLIFPTGHFSGVWTVIEIDRAIELGATVEWLDSKWIGARPVFGEFVERLYQFRDKSRSDYDEALAYVAKIMMNSLYGKFATNTLRDKIVYVNPGDETPEGGLSYNPDDPECPLWSVEEEIDAPYIAPQIAAHITAIARLNLHGYALESIKRGGELAYCDTDAIQTTADLSDLCGPELGKIKDEGCGVIYSGEYLQPKLYMLKGDDGSEKVIMKGYRNRTAEAFTDVKLGGTLSFDSLEKIGAMVRKGFADGPKMITITRSLQSEDNKRVFDRDGNSRPIVLREEILGGRGITIENDSSLKKELDDNEY